MREKTLQIGRPTVARAPEGEGAEKAAAVLLPLFQQGGESASTPSDVRETNGTRIENLQYPYRQEA